MLSLFSPRLFLHPAFRISTSPTPAEASQAPLAEQQGQAWRRLAYWSVAVSRHIK